jgi:outer membrane protease
MSRWRLIQSGMSGPAGGGKQLKDGDWKNGERTNVLDTLGMWQISERHVDVTRVMHNTRDVNEGRMEDGRWKLSYDLINRTCRDTTRFD